MAIDIEESTPVDSRITLNRSIPGQGLTNDPESPYPWEKAPEFTALDTSLQYIFGLLIDPENYVPIMDVIADGTALMDITQGILFKGFTEGKWNPDLMMLLAEPVAYILLALAERADINPKIYKGEEEDEDNEATLFDMEIGKAKLKKLKEFSTTKEIPAGAIPKDIEEQIEELPIPSLLSKPEEEEEEDTSSDSLLGRE